MPDFMTQLDFGGWLTWLTSDPTGQQAGLGLLIALLAGAAFLLTRGGQALAKRCKHVPVLLLLCGGVFYAAVLLLQLDPSHWAPAAGVAALSLFVLALVGLLRTKSKPKPKPA